MNFNQCRWALAVAVLTVALLPVGARAGSPPDAAGKLPAPAQRTAPFLLAQMAPDGEADGGMHLEGQERLHLSSEGEERKWKPRRFTANKVHKYLGLGSLGAAALAGLTTGTASASDPNSGLHHYAATTAAALGGGAVLSGLVFHWGDYRLRDGLLDPDNLHALLGMAGTAGYAMALDSAPDSEHQDAGMAGMVAMLISIRIAW